MKEIVKLQHPFTHAGMTYTEVAFRVPKARDVRRIGNMADTDVNKTHQMLVDLTELPADVLDEMDPRDYLALNGKIMRFLVPSQETLEK